MNFRKNDDRAKDCSERIQSFFRNQHALLAEDPDLTVISIRATTYPEARVARRVLRLNDRTIGLLAEIILQGRMRRDLRYDVDVLVAARALFHVATGARISWANGLLTEQGCRDSIDASVRLIFVGMNARTEAR